MQLLCRRIFRGFGQFGQLGHGGINDEILPRKIDEFEEEDCVYVAAGGNSMLPFFVRFRSHRCDHFRWFPLDLWSG